MSLEFARSLGTTRLVLAVLALAMVGAVQAFTASPAAAQTPCPPGTVAVTTGYPTSPAGTTDCVFTGPLAGAVPAPGSIGLLVEGQTEPTVALVQTLTAQNCSPVSLAITQSGQWIVYIPGAPAVVNAAFPPTMTAGTPFFVRCA